jgi:uncharacterized protein YdaU (DUF1376 family)
MARKPDDWMPLLIGRYLANTAHLSRDQHGAYLLLLMAYWTNGGPLDADDKHLAAIARATPSEWKKLKPVLVRFFSVADGKWSQRRCDAELVRAKSITEAKSTAGKNGAEKRWQSNGNAIGKRNGKHMAEPSISHRQTDAPIPLPKHSSNDEEDSPGEFDSFLAVFPKKEQIDNARKAYAAAREGGATAEAILAGAKRFAAHVEREKIPLKFTSLAKTWLADGCWKDQYGEPEAEVVLPPLHPSWPAEVVTRWEKSLGQVIFRTYLGPAKYVEADPPRVLFSNTHRRRLAEEHCPRVAKEVALEVAA